MNLPTNPLARSFIHALGVLGYTAFAATIINAAETLFDDGPSLLGAVAFLMLFVLSAAVVGTLIFVKPVLLFVNGEKKEAVNFLGLTLAWLTIITTLILTTRIILS